MSATFVCWIALSIPSVLKLDGMTAPTRLERDQAQDWRLYMLSEHEVETPTILKLQAITKKSW